MTTRRAECSCGALSITTTGDPVRISMCHCLACQRRTGSTFGAQARWTEENVRAEGPATTFVRKGDSGGTISFSFCPTCGATVYYRIDAMPGFVAVPLGAFADPSFPSPKISIYEARKHAWTGIPADAEHMD
jgi:hypothetical protein